MLVLRIDFDFIGEASSLLRNQVECWMAWIVELPSMFRINRSGGAFGLATLVTSAVLIDFAVSANLVFGQRAIYALGAEERGRLNGLFMATFFAGGAITAALGGWCFVLRGLAGSACR